MKVLIKVAWDENADRSIPLPTFQSTGSAGADVHANFGTNQTAVTILPGDRLLIPTGFSLEIPSDYEIQIRPRSGLAIKYGITLLNSPGTIDSDYRGLVGIILINNGQGAYLGFLKPSYNTFRIDKQTSKPIKSASCNGPIGCRMPPFIIASIPSILPIP